MRIRKSRETLQHDATFGSGVCPDQNDIHDNHHEESPPDERPVVKESASIPHTPEREVGSGTLHMDGVRKDDIRFYITRNKESNTNTLEN